MERWVKVPGYEKWYEVSDLGNFRSYYIGNGTVQLREIPKIKGQSYSTHFQYISVELRRFCKGKVYPSHIIVAKAFVPNPGNKKYVNHINGDKTDNRAINLEWCTAGENQKHAYATGLRKRNNGVQNGRNKLSVQEVIDIFNTNENHYVLAAAFGVHRSIISNIKSGKIWSTLTGKIYEKSTKGQLTNEQIIDIYTSSLTCQKLSDKHGVATSFISNIKRGLRFEHITSKL
jgi:hypothetical protein